MMFGKDEFQIRPMRLEDIDQVHLIDILSFPLPWPRNSYRNEIQETQRSRCWVVEQIGEPILEPGSTAPQLARIVGMAVVWLIVDEAHIATIAVHPDFRRLGIAARLLSVIVSNARREKMLCATLEVRASNLAAQALYQKFGFVEVGRRFRYYQDNQEDALIMTVQFDEPEETGVAELS